MSEWREVAATQTLTFDKRGRMLRRARKFGLPETYERTIHAKAWVRGGDVAMSFSVTPSNRVRPSMTFKGNAHVSPPVLTWGGK